MYKYHVGIDGGGTKTLLIMKDSKGKKKLYKEYPSSNFQSIGKNKFEALVGQILCDIRESADDCGFEDISLCFGGAGVDREIDKIYVREVFVRQGYDGKLQVYNDAVIGLVGGNDSTFGAIMIAGTGSIALGFDGTEEFRVGGWGHLIGDEGSGYKISVQILNEILKSIDGRTSREEDSKNLLDIINLKDQDDILEFVYTNVMDKSQIAGLAKMFLASYDESEIVRMVLDNNLEENLDMIRALSKRMKKTDFELCLCGGLFEKSDIYYGLMREKVINHFPSAQVHRPKLSPVEGALILAKKGEV